MWKEEQEQDLSMTGETESQRQAQSSLVGRDGHSGTQRNKKARGVSQLSHGDGEEREGSFVRGRRWHYASPETSIRPRRKLWAPLQKGVFLCVLHGHLLQETLVLYFE